MSKHSLCLLNVASVWVYMSSPPTHPYHHALLFADTATKLQNFSVCGYIYRSNVAQSTLTLQVAVSLPLTTIWTPADIIA